MNSTPNWNERLRQAVHSEEVPPFLEARIRNRLSEAERLPESRKSWLQTWRLAPVAAALAVMAGAGVAYNLGHLRYTASSQESYIASVSTKVATLMRVGLGDHIHCSVFRKYPKNPPTLEKFTQDLGPQYAGLLPIVRSKVSEEYTLRLAHQCKYNGRKFVHFALNSGNQQLSLVLARKADGESFDTEGLLPALVQSGLPIYQSGVQRFAIDAFESRDHLVYFVSDLPKQENAGMMVALAPSIRHFLGSLEI